MSGLQVVVNIFLAVVTYIIIQWLFGYLPDFPGILSFLIAVIAAVAVFSTNTARYIGVK